MAEDIQGAVVVVAAPDVGQDDVFCSGPKPDVLLKLVGHEAAVNGLCWHPTEPMLASASFDKTALLWDTDNPEAPAVAALKGHSSSLTAVAFAGIGGSFVVTASADKTAAIYDTVTAQRIRCLRGHTSHITSVDAKTSNGGGGCDYLLATGSNDRTTKVWDSRNRRRGAELVLSHEYQVLDVRFGISSDANCSSTFIYTSGVDPRVYIWDMRNANAPVNFLEGHTDLVTGISVSRLGSHLASHGADGRVGVWDVRPFVGGGDKKRLGLCLVGCAHGFEQNLQRPDWDKGGMRIAAGSADGSVLVWDADDGELLCKLGGHKGCVNDVRFSPTVDTLLASASSDASILLGHIPANYEGTLDAL
jgi:Prp8 binding protein